VGGAAAGIVTEPVLSPRALNRALLARQLLLDRSTLSLTEALEQVGGLQTQYSPSGYIGLWSRLRDFERPMLTDALIERRAIQGTIMRATIHTVSAADYWPMTAGVRRARREWFLATVRRELDGIDLDALAAAIRDELAAGPLQQTELTKRLIGRGFPSRAATAPGMHVDLVRAPPSGTWERRRADLYALADSWLPPSVVTEEEGRAHLVRRYLGAFGPAPVRDVASWMGVATSLISPTVSRLHLREYRDAAGKSLFDVPDAPLPDPGTRAPVRFLPTWDAMLLVHARRTGVLPEAYRPRIFNTKAPHSFNTFLVDGHVAGTWRFEHGRIELTPFEPLASADRRALGEEAERLAAFHAD
jgi:hypothetical protein